MESQQTKQTLELSPAKASAKVRAHTTTDTKQNERGDQKQKN